MFLQKSGSERGSKTRKKEKGNMIEGDEGKRLNIEKRGKGVISNKKKDNQRCRPQRLCQKRSARSGGD